MGHASARTGDSDAEVSEVGEEHVTSVIHQVFRTEEIRRLMRLFVKKGYTPCVGDASLLRSDHRDTHWHTVIIPIEDGAQNEKTYLAWSDNPHLDQQTYGVHTEHFDPLNEEGWWNVTKYWYEGVTLTTETKRTPNFLGCDTINWGCVLSLAGAYGGTIAACGTCAATSGWVVWACAACISAILGSAGATMTCQWCHG